MKPSPLQEQDGAWSMRRLLALICVANAVKISWNPATPWLSILVFMLCALMFLGLTTWQEIQSLAKYKITDAISSSAIIDDGSTNDNTTMGFKIPKEKQNEDSNTH